MRIVITGATGLIGRRLVVDRLERGDQVSIISRHAAAADRIFAASVNRNITVVSGNPAAPGPWQRAIDGCDVIIHLAGAGLTDRRWNSSFKKEISSSRVDSTHQVVSAIEKASERPKLLISGSAIGYYPDAGDAEIDEQHRAGTGFLAHVCKSWEQQALGAEPLGVRVVLLRTSVVLDNRGGALKKMVVPFKFFVGGPLGSGRQYMSWIHWRDLLGLIDLAIEDQAIRGPLNASAPHPIQQREMASAIGYVLNRPSWLPAPRVALRLALGEIASSMTASQRVMPRKALAHHYAFLYPEIESALRSLLRPEENREEVNLVERAPMMSATPSAASESASGDSPSQNREAPTVPIKLVAVAVDGALLNSDGSIAQGVVQSCRAAARIGVPIVLATARPPRACRAILQTLDLDFPTINYNGAIIWDPKRDQPQYEESLAAPLAREIIETARASNPELSIQIEIRDRWYIDRIDTRILPLQERLIEPDGVGPLDPHLHTPITRLSIVGFPEQVQACLAIIREKYWRPRAVAVFLPDPRVVQITHPMVDKAIALQRLIRRMSLAREEVMAIGGSANDAGMIEWAGHGIVVGNAPASVKKLATAIVPSNNELGVAKALQRFVLANR